MKKIICIAILCLACIFTFYGCSDKSNGEGSATETKNTGTVVGKIEAIDGNKITLALADTTDGTFGNGRMPSGDFGSFDGQMPENFDPESFGGELPDNFNVSDIFGGEIPEGFDPESFGGELPDNFNVSDIFGGEIPEGFDPESFGGEMPDKENMPEGFENFASFGGINFDSSSLTYTGETKTYTVPEGMKIGDGDYTSLKVGDVIMISFDQEGGIAEITVMPAQRSTDKATTA